MFLVSQDLPVVISTFMPWVIARNPAILQYFEPMTTLINSVSPPIANPPSIKHARKAHLPRLRSIPQKNGNVSGNARLTTPPNDRVFIPSIEPIRDDPRHLVNVFLHLENMVGLGNKPDAKQATTLSRALCTVNKFEKAGRVIELMLSSDVSVDPACFEFVLSEMCRKGHVNSAMALVEKLKENGFRSDSATYDILLTGLCWENRVDEAIRFFRDWPSQGVIPNVNSYNILLRLFCLEERWQKAYELLKEMIDVGCPPSACTYNMLVDVLASQGRTEDALKVLDEMRSQMFKPTAATYNPIIAQLCKERKVDEVSKCLDQMLHHRCAPDPDTYSAIAVLCNEGMVLEAFSIIHDLRFKLTFTSFSTHAFFTSVISGLCKRCNTYAALQLLYEMTKSGFTPGPPTYSSMIRGLCSEKMVNEAMQIFEMLEESGYRPTVDNYNALLSGLCKFGHIDIALDLFNSMIEKGCMPSETTYFILVRNIAFEEHELGALVFKELCSRQLLTRRQVKRIAKLLDYLRLRFVKVI